MAKPRKYATKADALAAKKRRTKARRDAARRDREDDLIAEARQDRLAEASDMAPRTFAPFKSMTISADRLSTSHVDSGGGVDDEFDEADAMHEDVVDDIMRRWR